MRIALAIVLVMAAVQILSIRQECQTWDEGFEIASGYGYLRTGEYRISPEQPPLARVLAALPLLALNPLPPDIPRDWENHDREIGIAFLYRNRVPADSIVFAARLPTILTTCALGLLMFWWTRRAFGPLAAVLALLLFALDPNVIANGRYVKNDMLLTLLSFSTVIAWGAFLRTGRMRAACGAGLLLGAALATKFAAAFLLPVMALLWVRERLRGGLRAAVLVITGAVLVPLIVYAPDIPKLRIATRGYRANHPNVLRIGNALSVQTRASTAVLHAATSIGIQDHALLVGLLRFLDHSSGGHEAYLLGQHSTTGWWYYFPVAFLVKTPITTLLAIALALSVAGGRAYSRGLPRLRHIRSEWWLCALPPPIFLIASIVNKVNTAERHLLPIYPFLFILTAALLAPSVNLRLRGFSLRLCENRALVLALLLALESFSVYPHYLAFFNFAAGGPASGPRYLVDANIDWGQDLLKLRTWWINHGRPPLCLMYFGTAPPEYYGITYGRVARSWETQERRDMDCFAAVSVTSLQDVYIQPGSMVWLRERQPVERVGYSIYIYDLRRRQ